MLSSDFTILKSQLEDSKLKSSSKVFELKKSCLSSLILLASIGLSTIVPIVIIDVTYLAWFNVSPFAFIRAGGVLGHGVPLSKCRYVQTSLFKPLCSNRQFIFFLDQKYFLSGFYSVLFNFKWLWLVKWYILYNRFLTKALLIAYCLSVEKTLNNHFSRISFPHLGHLDRSLISFRTS